MRIPSTRPSNRLFCFVFLVASVGGEAVAQSACSAVDPVPVGSEFRINVAGGSQHRNSAVVAEKAGGFLVGWTFITSTGVSLLHGRHFSADGAATSADMDLMEPIPTGSNITLYFQIYGRPVLLSRPNHAFQALWSGTFEEFVPPSSYITHQGIVTRQYLADGTRVTGYVPAAVNFAGQQSYAGIAETGFDSFVAVWSGTGTGDSNGVFHRQFLSTGMPAEEESLVNVTTANGQFQPRVASRSDGRYVVVWRGNGPGDDQGIFMRAFNPSGQPLGGEVRVNTTTAATQYAPDIAMAANGRFVVVWSGYAANNSPVVYAQRYDGNRLPVGGEIVVSSELDGSQQSAPAVAMMPDGGFVVASHGNGPGDDVGVFLRRYDEFGQANASLVRVNSTVAENQTSAAVAVAPGGEIMVTWHGNGMAGDFQTYGQVYARPARVYRSNFASPDGPCPY